MHHFEKTNSKIFSPEGPCEHVWGPRDNVSLGSAVALDGPVTVLLPGFSVKSFKPASDPCESLSHVRDPNHERDVD